MENYPEPGTNPLGFFDPSGNYPKYAETDMNRLAVNDTENPHLSYMQRRADRDLAVGVANVDATTVVDDTIDADDGKFWDEPPIPYAAQYPHNHVYETEGGHLREMDDTPDAKRIHERHASGSGYEIHNDGSKVTRVTNDNYNIITNDEYCHIQGTARHTVDKGLRVRVNSSSQAGNNYNIEVGQGSNVNVEVNGGNINLTTLGTGEDAGDININASRDLNMQIARNMNINVLNTITEDSKVKTQSTQEKLTENSGTHDINTGKATINGGSEIDANASVINLN